MVYCIAHTYIEKKLEEVQLLLHFDKLILQQPKDPQAVFFTLSALTINSKNVQPKRSKFFTSISCSFIVIIYCTRFLNATNQQIPPEDISSRF